MMNLLPLAPRPAREGDTHTHAHPHTQAYTVYTHTQRQICSGSGAVRSADPETLPKTKHDVYRMTHCREMAICDVIGHVTIRLAVCDFL